MIKVVDLCTECAHVITNPICPHCFTRHVLTWIRDKNLSQKEVRKITTYLRKLVIEAEETPTEINCIICGAKKVNLCIYCLTEKILRIMRKTTANRITNDFEEDFNTILWRHS